MKLSNYLGKNGSWLGLDAKSGGTGVLAQLEGSLCPSNSDPRLAELIELFRGSHFAESYMTGRLN